MDIYTKISFIVFVTLFVILVILGALAVMFIPENIIYLKLFGAVFAVTFGSMIIFIIIENRPKKKKSSFEEYLKKEAEKGNIDFSIRIDTNHFGFTKFYIHPQNVGGETADFRILDDTLTRI